MGLGEPSTLDATLIPQLTNYSFEELENDINDFLCSKDIKNKLYMIRTEGINEFIVKNKNDESFVITIEAHITRSHLLIAFYRIDDYKKVNLKREFLPSIPYFKIASIFSSNF